MKTTITTVEIPDTLHTRLKIEAARRGLRMKEANEEAIRLWLKAKPSSPPALHKPTKQELQPA